MKKRDFCITTLGVLVFYFLLIINNGIIYSVNDDIALRAISSGKYMGIPSVYMIFSGFPYSSLLVLLYNITNKIDWYGLVLLLSTIFYLFYTIYNIIKQEKDSFLKVIYMIFVLIITALVYNKFLIQMTFTAVSIFVATCCLILYLLPQNSKIKNIIIFVGIILSFGLRIKACAMILIFFVPALFYKNYRNKENLKKDIFFGLKIAIVLLVCFFIERSLYNSYEWKEYSKYNKLRSLYYDYYYDTVEKLPKEFINEMFKNAGFSEEEIKIMRTYGGIAFYDDIPDKMEALIEQFNIHNIKLNSSFIKTILAVLEENSTKYYIITLVLILYIIAFSKEKKEKILTILPFILLQILILGYLIKEGRIPDRVITPLQYCYIVTNLYIVMKEEKIKKNLVNILKHNKIMIIIITLVIFTMSLNIKIDERTSTSLKIGNSMEKYFKENSNNFYIYDNNFLTEFEFFNGMKVNNYINMSGWTAYSPIYMERLKSLDVESLKDLLLRDNVYLILDKSLNINDYKNIILNAKIEKIESVERFNIYKFTK